MQLYLQGQAFDCRDASLFPYFLEFVKTGGEAEEAQLLKELKKIDEFLSKSEGNFFGGTEVNALDLQIAPKLKHISIGAKAVHVRQSFSIPLRYTFSCCKAVPVYTIYALIG